MSSVSFSMFSRLCLWHVIWGIPRISHVTPLLASIWELYRIMGHFRYRSVMPVEQMCMIISLYLYQQRYNKLASLKIIMPRSHTHRRALRGVNPPPPRPFGSEKKPNFLKYSFPGQFQTFSNQFNVSSNQFRAKCDRDKESEFNFVFGRSKSTTQPRAAERIFIWGGGGGRQKRAL